MAEIGRTAGGTWHFLGKHRCHIAARSEIVETTRFYEELPGGAPDVDAEDWCSHCEDVLGAFERVRRRTEREQQGKFVFQATREGHQDEWIMVDHDWDDLDRGELPDCDVCRKENAGIFRKRMDPDHEDRVCEECTRYVHPPVPEIELLPSHRLVPGGYQRPDADK